MIFNVDFDKWVATMLPTFLRRRRVFAFCRALCSPLYLGPDSVYSRFLEARSGQNYRMRHNGQVCYLRAALNDAFGLTKGFEIEDAEGYKGDWVFAKDPSMPGQLLAVDEKLNPAYDEEDTPEQPTPVLADEVKINAPRNSFVVRVPARIFDTQLEKVDSIVNQYRILSKIPIYSPL